MTARPRREMVVVLALLVAPATLIGLRTIATGGESHARKLGGVPQSAGPLPRLALGVTTPSLARNSWRRWRPADLAEVDTFERAAGQHVGVVMWFADWARAQFDARQAGAVAQRGSVPEISWEPWDSRIGLYKPQPRYTLRSVISGRHDAYIGRWATGIARYGGPVRLRFAHEMNGTWYPWSEGRNGNRRGEYRKAWRHIHAIFEAKGADNVTWVWSPVAARIPGRLYPGVRYVDAVGLSGLNGGSVLFDRRWRSFRASYAEPLDTLERLAPTKPIEISEVATTEHGGDKAKWIEEMFAEVRRRPAIRSLNWFELRKETDWRIVSSPRARRAFAKGARERPLDQPNLVMSVRNRPNAGFGR